MTPLNCILFNHSFVLCNLSSYRTGKFYSNRGATDSSAHGDKSYDGHSWAPSFDHGIDNDSLWNFGHKVGFCSRFLALYHVVDILHHVIPTSDMFLRMVRMVIQISSLDHKAFHR